MNVARFFKLSTVAIAICTTCIFSANPSHASLVFDFDTTSGGGGTVNLLGEYTHSIAGMDGGVSFTAILTVKGLNGDGSSAPINITNNGLGVDGSIGNPNEINNGELVTYSLAISSVVGGSVSFDGFSSFTHCNGARSGDLVLSKDQLASTLPDNFFTGSAMSNANGTAVDISGTSPSIFSAIAATDSTGSNYTFRACGVGASFTGTSVPEPSSFMMFGLVISSLAFRRKS